MAISLASLRRGGALRPPRIITYGTHGVGKTTFACGAPAPVVIPVEDGLGTLDVDSFPLVKTFGEVMEALGSLATDDHKFKTAIIDSLDWLEPLIWAETCARQTPPWRNIEAPGYGKGYLAALDLWREYIDAINWLRDERGMMIIQIAHSDIKRFDDPEHEPYDRYRLKLHDRASALLQEHADIVLFNNYRVSTVKTDVGFNKKVTRGAGGGERLLYTSERPAFLAKNRFSLPDEISIGTGEDAAASIAKAWAALSPALPESHRATA